MKKTNQTEMEILICCARTQMTPDTEGRLQQLLTLPIHWENLRQLAAYHKIIPLLFHHLSRQSSDTIPRDWFARLRDAAHGHVVWNYHQLENLRQLTERLEAHGIPVIPYKGVALSLRLYGGLELRHTGDLDIIVPPAEYWRAKALLEADGLHCAVPMPPEVEAEMVRESSELSLFSAEKNLILELHWGVSPRYFSFPFAAMNLWEQTSWQEFNGCRFRQTNDEDTLILLCVHGAQHAWSTLKWISDIAALLQCPIAWEQVLKRARTLQCERMVLVGVGLAHQLLGTALPDNLQQKIARSMVLKRLLQGTIRRLRCGGKQPGVLAIMPFHVMVREHWQDRCQYFGLLYQSLHRNWLRAREGCDNSLRARLWRPARLLQLYFKIGRREYQTIKSSAVIERSNAA